MTRTMTTELEQQTMVDQVITKPLAHSSIHVQQLQKETGEKSALQLEPQLAVSPFQDSYVQTYQDPIGLM